MKVKSHKDFEYWLWKKDGQCWVRIKATKECFTVDLETFRFLNNEQVKLSRGKLNVVYVPKVYRRELGHNVADDVITNMLEEEFFDSLTYKQNEICDLLKRGLNKPACAKRTGTSVSSVRSSIMYIRKKYKNIFQ